MDIADVLARFPKARPGLPEAYRRIYDEFYYKNREGEYATTSASKRLESWLHRKVAADRKEGDQLSTLEIGAGTLNQLPYEPDGGAYDIVEPYAALVERSRFKERIRNRYAALAEVPTDARYDRITSVAAFEHLEDLPATIARAALLLRDGGTLRTSIPNEGRLGWRAGTMVTGTEFYLRFGLDYQVLMRHEHLNTADEIEAVLGHFFKNNKRSIFGMGKTFAFYRFYESSAPDRARAEAYLAGRGLA